MQIPEEHKDSISQIFPWNIAKLVLDKKNLSDIPQKNNEYSFTLTLSVVVYNLSLKTDLFFIFSI